MFQHADFGERTGPPVPVPLVLLLQSLSCASGRRTSSGAGAGGATVFKDGDFNHSHASLDGVCEEQTSGCIDLLILLLNIHADLFQDLFIACLHAQEDDVGRRTSQAAFQVGLTANLFSLCIIAVERLHRFFEQAPFDPAVQLCRELGLEFADGTVTVVSLNEDLGGQRCTVTQLLKVVKLCRHDA